MPSSHIMWPVPQLQGCILPRQASDIDCTEQSRGSSGLALGPVSAQLGAKSQGHGTHGTQAERCVEVRGLKFLSQGLATRMQVHWLWWASEEAAASWLLGLHQLLQALQHRQTQGLEPGGRHSQEDSPTQEETRRGGQSKGAHR